MDTKTFWKAVARKRQELETDVVFLTSLDNEATGQTGGAICECVKSKAAEFIVNGTHRQSTPPEIEKFRLDQAARERACRVAEEQSAKQRTGFMQAHELVQALQGLMPRDGGESVAEPSGKSRR